jgi:glycosyltransferase involved in cell wall biosynthesis
MRILFVHQNFPAQFVHLAPELVRRGHEVLALTEDTNQRPLPVPHVAYRFDAPKFASRAPHNGFDSHALRGAAVARAAQELRNTRGWVPDVIFGHVGWGESMYLTEVWPEARLLAYAELYWRSRGLYYDFDPAIYARSLDQVLDAATTTAAMLVTLAAADKLVSPTHWQARSFPEVFHPRIHVIHDGIDTAVARPSASASVSLAEKGLTLKAGDEVLTFVNRTLEPHRGFHVFMRALPAVLRERPNAHVVIVGGTEGGYGAGPGKGRTWRQMMLEEVGRDLDLSRIYFVGKVPHNVFLDLMRVSRAHAYLTYPGVLSWSMLEAMSCGALVIGSRTPPVEEVIEDGVNGRLVDFFDVAGWSAALIMALAHPEPAMDLRRAARQTILDRYDLASRCLPEMVRFVEES